MRTFYFGYGDFYPIAQGIRIFYQGARDFELSIFDAALPPGRFTRGQGISPGECAPFICDAGAVFLAFPRVFYQAARVFYPAPHKFYPAP